MNDEDGEMVDVALFTYFLFPTPYPHFNTPYQPLTIGLTVEG